jgi:hypothetical protein
MHKLDQMLTNLPQYTAPPSHLQSFRAPSFICSRILTPATDVRIALTNTRDPVTQFSHSLYKSSVNFSHRLYGSQIASPVAPSIPQLI